MSIILPEENKFELTPAGTHVATCYRVLDIGTQLVEYKGESKKQHKIMISWELTDEKMEDGRPFSIHKQYTLSSNDKAQLRKDLQSWRGVPFSDEDFGKFDIGVLIGKSCLVGIVHTASNGTTYANITSIMKLPKGTNAPALINATVYFSLNDFNQDIYDGLSENIKAKIAKSPEYQSIKGADKADPNTADDRHDEYSEAVPF